MDVKRGYVPEDERNISPEAIEIMRTASRHIRYLLDEGYDLKQASTFVGNHFLLSERQRLAIVRSLASGKQLAERMKKQVPMEQLAGKEVWTIDARTDLKWKSQTKREYEADDPGVL